MLARVLAGEVEAEAALLRLSWSQPAAGPWMHQRIVSTCIHKAEHWQALVVSCILTFVSSSAAAQAVRGQHDNLGAE